MTPQDSSEERWDFYLCKVDDAPASIFLDLALRDSLDDASRQTLYALQVSMTELGEHGMGTATEADALNPIEDVIAEEARTVGLRLIGRLRNHGIWQLTFMGPADHEERLNRIAKPILASSGRAFELVSQPDPEWSYYREFLYPNAERERWMKDKSVVEALEQHGDPLIASRRVDHWVYFPSAAKRSAYAQHVTRLGFEIVGPEDESDDSTFRLQIHRIDSVQLEAIHEVTEELSRLAQNHEGEYDGWETSVAKAD